MGNVDNLKSKLDMLDSDRLKVFAEAEGLPETATALEIATAMDKRRERVATLLGLKPNATWKEIEAVPNRHDKVEKALKKT